MRSHREGVLLKNSPLRVVIVLKGQSPASGPNSFFHPIPYAPYESHSSGSLKIGKVWKSCDYDKSRRYPFTDNHEEATGTCTRLHSKPRKRTSYAAILESMALLIYCSTMKQTLSSTEKCAHHQLSLFLQGYLHQHTRQPSFLMLMLFKRPNPLVFKLNSLRSLSCSRQNERTYI